MRIQILDQDIALAEDRRLIKKLWKIDKDKYFPEGLEFAYQYIYFKDKEWIQIARIDNQLHENKPGTHIHILKREKVIWKKMDFKESERKILEISESIIKNMIDKV